MRVFLDTNVLVSSVAAQSDALVTGDHDLLDFAGDVAVKIVSSREFWDLLRSTEPTA